MSEPGGQPRATLDAAWAAAHLPPRDPRGHKGTFGRLSVVAGSLDYAGAALMAGAAALRTGCGVVTLWVLASLQPVLAGRVPELVTRGLPETAPGEVRESEAAAMVLEQAHEALLVGPGLRPGRATGRLVTALLADEGPPAVVDAGALEALAGQPGWSRHMRRACVLTPHPGELRRFGREPGGDDATRAAAATEAAEAWGQVVVLKGAGTVVAGTTAELLVAPFALAALGTAGSGDVLAGVIASLLAQGLPPFEAAGLGVYLHGRAGELASEALGDAGMLATDLLARLPLARRELRDQREQLGARELREPTDR